MRLLTLLRFFLLFMRTLFIIFIRLSVRLTQETWLILQPHFIQYSKSILMLNPTVWTFSQMIYNWTQRFRKVDVKPRRAPFRLLSLPDVALHRVMAIMNPHDLVLFSMCSAKSRESYRKWKTKSIVLELCLRDDPRDGKVYELVMRSENDEMWYSFLVNHAKHSVEIKEHKTVLGNIKLNSSAKLWKSEGGFRWNTESNNSIEGLKKWTDCVVDLFDCHVHSIVLDTSAITGSDTRRTLEWLRQYQCSVERLSWYGEMEESNARYFFDNFRRNGKVEISSVSISDSRWIRLEDMLEMKSQLLTLQNSYLSDEDINSLLKSWLDKRMPDLEFICLSRKNNRTMFRLETIFEGIERTTLNLGRRRLSVPAMKKPQAVQPHFTLSGGMRFERDDGVWGLLNIGTNFGSRLPVLLFAVQPEPFE